MEKRLEYYERLSGLGYRLVRKTSGHVLAVNPNGNRAPVTIILDWPMLIAAKAGSKRIKAFTPYASRGLIPDEGPVCVIDREFRMIKGYGYAYKIEDTLYYNIELKNGRAERWDYLDFLLASKARPPIEMLLDSIELLKPIILTLVKLFTIVSPEYNVTMSTYRLPSVVTMLCVNGRPLADLGKQVLCINAEGKPPRIIKEARDWINRVPPASIGL